VLGSRFRLKANEIVLGPGKANPGFSVERGKKDLVLFNLGPKYSKANSLADQRPGTSLGVNFLERPSRCRSFHLCQWEKKKNPSSKRRKGIITPKSTGTSQGSLEERGGGGVPPRVCLTKQKNWEVHRKNRNLSGTPTLPRRAYPGWILFLERSFIRRRRLLQKTHAYSKRNYTNTFSLQGCRLCMGNVERLGGKRKGITCSGPNQTQKAPGQPLANCGKKNGPEKRRPMKEEAFLQGGRTKTRGVACGLVNLKMKKKKTSA